MVRYTDFNKWSFLVVFSLVNSIFSNQIWAATSQEFTNSLKGSSESNQDPISIESRDADYKVHDTGFDKYLSQYSRFLKTKQKFQTILNSVEPTLISCIFKFRNLNSKNDSVLKVVWNSRAEIQFHVSAGENELTFGPVLMPIGGVKISAMQRAQLGPAAIAHNMSRGILGKFAEVEFEITRNKEPMQYLEIGLN